MKRYTFNVTVITVFKKQANKSEYRIPYFILPPAYSTCRVTPQCPVSEAPELASMPHTSTVLPAVSGWAIHCCCTAALPTRRVRLSQCVPKPKLSPPLSLPPVCRMLYTYIYVYICIYIYNLI